MDKSIIKILVHILKESKAFYKDEQADFNWSNKSGFFGAETEQKLAV